MNNGNRQFANRCSNELALEDKRQQQWITPFLDSLGLKWKYCKLHSKGQTYLKIDGYIDDRILFENKCISKDQPNFFAEISINRGSYIEKGWMTKPFHELVERYPIYMFVAFETFMKIYDYKAIKAWCNSISIDELKSIGGWVWNGEDRSLGGIITGWNIPLKYMERFEIKEFGNTIK